MNEKQIQLAPGVTLALGEHAQFLGGSAAALPPGRYSVEVECKIRDARFGSLVAAPGAVLTILVKGALLEGGEA